MVYPSVTFAGCSIAQRVPRSGVRFYWYEDFLDFTDHAVKRTYRDFGATQPGCLPPTARKVVWPTREELAELLWTMPLTKIAAQFGVSRGYWLKKMKTSPLSVAEAPEPPKLQEEVRLL